MIENYLNSFIGLYKVVTQLNQIAHHLMCTFVLVGSSPVSRTESLEM